MSKEVKKSIAIQGSILALAGIITKIIGFIYRIPMANILKNNGNGLYSVAFGIYNIALTLSSYSMPLAVSKLMSERLAKKEYKNAHRLYARAFIFAVCTGLIACLALYFGADFFAGLYKREGLERPLRILAPTTFVVALLGTCRGFFQGHRNMVPTAVSQIFEQIVNAIVSVVASWYFIKQCTVETEEASYGAMGGTMGTLAGAMTALLIFAVLFLKRRKTIAEEKQGEDAITESNKLIFKAIFLTVLPIIISQSIYQLGYTVDDLLYGNIMAAKGMDAETATSLQGVFNTQYNQMVNLPVAIATAMASATLPSVVASYTTGAFDSVKRKITMVLKMNMMIAIPASIGLAALAGPIMEVLFSSLEDLHGTAVTLLTTGSFAVFFYALSTLSTSILQGCNRMRVPVVHVAISLAIHVLLVWILLTNTDLGVYALVIGNVSFPLLVSILNCISIRKYVEYQFDLKRIFLKPLLAAVVMGGATFGAYALLVRILGGVVRFGERTGLTRSKNAICLVVSIMVAAVVYGVMLIVLKAFTKEELKAMPLIKKFVK
ncbi:MAG: polysaccharide biosynthesis protein [Lachnospiraceae bacterium]|nr:polysaccharide biosynthesis protein [Lachnospiraceae bacterium]